VPRVRLRVSLTQRVLLFCHARTHARTHTCTQVDDDELADPSMAGGGAGGEGAGEGSPSVYASMMQHRAGSWRVA
jgi:hypothetical protein